MAMIYRDDIPDMWDFVVSAPWLERGKWKDMEYIGDHLVKVLGKKGIESLGRSVILPPEGSLAVNFLKDLEGMTGEVDIPGKFSGAPIRGYVFKAERNTKRSKRTVSKPRKSPSAVLRPPAKRGALAS